MVLMTCVRMLLRRLALRRTVALTTALLFLLGTCGMYYFYREGSYHSDDIQITRTVKMPTLSPHDSHGSTDASPTHSTKHMESEIGEHQNKSKMNIPAVRPSYEVVPSVYVLANNTAECQFSSRQTPNDANVQMMEVFDRLPYDDPDGGVWKQGFDISYSMAKFDENPLQVFIVPHSHNDPGWLRTFVDYYKRQTRNILNFVTDTLTANPRRKFIWAEISYLDLWWQEQGDARKHEFRKLVANGQMEIVTGGWVMNDEANTHYFAMIDQMMEGHMWMRENLPGVIPRSGWAIDPFGHTPTMAFLLQRMGLESMLIQRVHYAVKKELSRTKHLEFAWRQQWDQGEDNTAILCQLMPFYSYDIPHTCGPDPKVCCQFDFKRLPGSKLTCPWRVRPEAITDTNVAQRAEMLADQYRKKSQLFRTNVLLVPLGDDFRYETQKEVDTQFSNYERLIEYMNSHSEMKIQVNFGTLSDYFTALRQSVGTDGGLIPSGFPTLTGDFFTYSDREDNYWSGYFTSRPFHKKLTRELEANLRAAEILYSLARARGLMLTVSANDLTIARRNLGLFQHHDGITGTAKDPVVIDYATRMTEAITRCKNMVASSAQALLLPHEQQTDKLYFDLEETHPSADSIPHHTVVSLEDKVRTIVIFNPLAHERKQLVQIRVDRPDVMVKDAHNSTVPCQINPVWLDNGFSEKEFDAVFPVSLGPLGLSQFHLLAGNEGSIRATLQLINQNLPQSTTFHVEQYPLDDFTLKTDYIEARFSGYTGLMKSLVIGQTELNVEVDFITYGTRSSKDKSGAYLFLPDGDAKTIVAEWQKPPVTIIVGPLLQQVRSSLGLVTHSLELHNSPGPDAKTIGIRNIADIRKESNKELGMRLRTSVQNPNGIFYTDLNGLQLIRRRTVAKLPIQGNYYPMATTAVLEDQKVRLSLLSSQPLGAGALQQGWLEVMLDRRLMQDDARGLGQGVKDNLITIETFRLVVEERFGGSDAAASLVYPSLLSHRTLDHLLYPPLALITHSPSPISQHLAKSYSPLKAPLSCDLFMVNLRTMQASPTQSALILHRRGFECGFNMAPLQCTLSSGKVHLGDLFEGVTPFEVTETSLTLLHDRQSLNSSNLLTHLNPMDIKTFRLQWYM